MMIALICLRSSCVPLNESLSSSNANGCESWILITFTSFGLKKFFSLFLSFLGGHDDVRRSWSTCVRLEDRIALYLYRCQRQIWRCQRLLPPAAAPFAFLRGGPSYEGPRAPSIPSQSEDLHCAPSMDSQHSKSV